MQTTIEREYKFAVDEPAVAHGIGDWLRSLGVEIADQSGFTQRDTYYDSLHRDLVRHRVALRLREGERGSRLFFKGSPVVHKGLYSRPEVEIPWTDAVTRPSRLPERIRTEVEPFTFGRDLAVLAQLSTERQRFVLRGESSTEPPAELVVDTVSVDEAVNGARTFTEIELEVPSEPTVRWENLAQRLRSDLPVNPSQTTKLERALTLMGVEVASPGFKLPSAKTPMKRAAVQILARHFGSAQAREAGTRLGTNPEDLHKMRVAYRRLHAACQTFGTLFAPNLFMPALDLLRSSRRVMGPVRDADVNLEWLAGAEDRLPSYTRPGLSEVRERLLINRAHEREQMLLWLTSPKRLRGCEVFEGLLEALQTDRDGHLTVRDLAPGYVIGATRRVLKRSKRAHAHPEPAQLHKLRIAFKRMRYTSEEFAHIYPGLNKVRRRLVSMQDALGEYCDAENAIRLFIDLNANDSALSHEAQTTVQAVIGLEFSRRDAALKAFHKTRERFNDDKLRRELVRAFL